VQIFGKLCTTFSEHYMLSFCKFCTNYACH